MQEEYGRVWGHNIDFEFSSKGGFFNLRLSTRGGEMPMCRWISGPKRCEDGDMEAFKRRRSTELKNGPGPQKWRKNMLG